jgi:hypothetical protein
MTLGTPHLTIAHEPELDACIKQTHDGQAGWAGWHAPRGKTCVECRHFDRKQHKRLLQDFGGRCGKCRQLTGRRGARFSAQALACRYFEVAPCR